LETETRWQPNGILGQKTASAVEKVVEFRRQLSPNPGSGGASAADERLSLKVFLNQGSCREKARHLRMAQVDFLNFLFEVS
jgi:hypothetical protein